MPTSPRPRSPPCWPKPRQVAEKQHATPVVAETPFDSQGHTVAALMSYATGPDTQTVIPAGASVPAGKVRAEVVSAKPENLWDLMAKPGNPGQVVVVRPETVVVQPPAPPKQIVVKRELVVVKPEPVVKRDTVVSDPFVAAPAPVAKKLTLTPAPMPGPAMPKGESLTLDFPPPTAPYSPPAARLSPGHDGGEPRDEADRSVAVLRKGRDADDHQPAECSGHIGVVVLPRDRRDSGAATQVTVDSSRLALRRTLQQRRRRRSSIGLACRTRRRCRPTTRLPRPRRRERK